MNKMHPSCSDGSRTFHSNAGFYFERLSDGGVRIFKTETAQVDSPVAFEQTLDAATWCSVVLTMSAFNERPNDWHWWMSHHKGELDARSA